MRLTMPLETVDRTEATGALHHQDNSKGATVGSLSGEPGDPWNPPRPPPHPWIVALECPHQFNVKYMRQIADFLSKVRASNIIVPDRTPKGKAPRLCGMRANPNYITNFGFFPLHQAAESFSADMVEVLLHYGALANLRTSGDRIIDGLLPLHVAIENTCQHKYLEDNLLADQNYMKGNAEYVYKLIYLLCLPEMKIFLDTTRVLATHMDNVVDELWDCIKHGKLVPAAILLLAAHRHFRNLNRFDTIKTLIEDSVFDLEREGCGLKSDKNTKAAKQWKEKKVQFSNALVLVRIILKAGDAVGSYIQTHSKVSHAEVLAKVSEVLQNYDVGPSGNVICIEDLVWGDKFEECSHRIVVYTGSQGKNCCEKEATQRTEPLVRKRSVPSCLEISADMSVYVRTFPSYAPDRERPDTQYDGVQKKPTDRRSSSNVRLGMLDLLESRSQKLTGGGPKSAASSHRSQRLFGTAASTVLKMMKRA